MNAVWVFGDSAGIDFNIPNTPVPIFSSMDGRESCISLTDTNGNLILYANTVANTNRYSTQVWNKNNLIMQNSDSILGEAWYAELVLMQQPNYHDSLILFSSVGSSTLNGFYFSTIDIFKNNGLGEVVQKNVQLKNVRIADCLQAIQHGNGRDWWEVTKMSGPGNTYINRFYVYLVSPRGIAPPIILHTVIQEDKFWEIIHELKDKGAQGILVIPIEKMVL